MDTGESVATSGAGNLNNKARKKRLLNCFPYKISMSQRRGIDIEKGLGRNTDERNSITLVSDTKDKIISL